MSAPFLGSLTSHYRNRRPQAPRRLGSRGEKGPSPCCHWPFLYRVPALDFLREFKVISQSEALSRRCMPPTCRRRTRRHTPDGSLARAHLCATIYMRIAAACSTFLPGGWAPAGRPTAHALRLGKQLGQTLGGSRTLVPTSRRGAYSPR